MYKTSLSFRTASVELARSPSRRRMSELRGADGRSRREADVADRALDVGVELAPPPAGGLFNLDSRATGRRIYGLLMVFWREARSCGYRAVTSKSCAPDVLMRTSFNGVDHARFVNKVRASAEAIGCPVAFSI